MNCKYLFKDMPAAKLYAMLSDPHVKTKWQDNPVYNIISEDPNENSYVIHQVGKKPDVPMISAREFVQKCYRFESYLLKEDDGEEAHLAVRVNFENDIPLHDKNNVRGITKCMGELILPNKDINGCELHTIGHQDLAGQIPKIIVSKVVTKKATKIPGIITKFAESFEM